MATQISTRSQALTAMLIVLITCVACAGARTITPASGEPDPTVDPSVPAEIAEAIALRADLGLRADVDHVQAVQAAADSIRHEIGLLLTPGEADELDRRFEAQDQLGALTAYGAEHRDTFGGLYIDQAAGGDVVMLFTRDVERHARVASALAPAGMTVRVRQVDFAEAELTEVLDGLDFEALGPGVEMVGAGVDTIRNVATLEVKTNDAGFEQRTESEYGGRLDVTVHPVPGPWQNAAGGEGWSLLTAGEASGEEAYTVRAATDAPALAELWEVLGLGEEQPQVDFETDVVVSFAHGIGSSCPEIRLDDVTVGAEVFSLTSDPLSPRACTADLAGAAVFVVAVSRDAVPAAGFTLRLGEQTVTCDDCGFSEEIQVLLP